LINLEKSRPWAGTTISFFFQRIIFLTGAWTMESGPAIRQIAPAGKDRFPCETFAESEQQFSAVIVSADPSIVVAMAETLQGCSLKAVLANGLEELKSVCSGTRPIACLCGLELADGSFREVVEYLEQQPIQIPLIMVSPASVGETPACFLHSLRAGAHATLCYPYRLSDVQIVLWSVIQDHRESGRLPWPAQSPESEFEQFLRVED
jgi:CheY-like chemotaxis protein